MDTQENKLASLVAMGYEKEAAQEALTRASGNTEEAALALSEEKNKNTPAKFSSEPLNVPCMPVTSPTTGERVYIPLNLPETKDSWCHKPLGITDANSLLSRPVSELIRAADQLRLDRAKAESVVKEPIHEASLTKQELKDRKEAKKAGQHNLWADKYCPKNFMDLLSEGSVNREVLRWVKSWDECVFPNPKESKKAKASQHLGVRAEKEEKEDNRPDTKVQK